jgi:hypothetical protein
MCSALFFVLTEHAAPTRFAGREKASVVVFVLGVFADYALCVVIRVVGHGWCPPGRRCGNRDVHALG